LGCPSVDCAACSLTKGEPPEPKPKESRQQRAQPTGRDGTSTQKPHTTHGREEGISALRSRCFRRTRDSSAHRGRDAVRCLFEFRWQTWRAQQNRSGTITNTHMHSSTTRSVTLCGLASCSSAHPPSACSSLSSVPFSRVPLRNPAVCLTERLTYTSAKDPFRILPLFTRLSMTLLTGVRAVAARSASAVASSTGRSVVQPQLPSVAQAARCLATTAAAGGKPVNLALMGAPGVGQ
jgi:hypothetical protein